MSCEIQTPYTYGLAYFPPVRLIVSSIGNHVVFSSKSKHWLARGQGNVFEWCDMSIRGMLFQ